MNDLCWGTVGLWKWRLHLITSIIARITLKFHLVFTYKNYLAESNKRLTTKTNQINPLDHKFFLAKFVKTSPLITSFAMTCRGRWSNIMFFIWTRVGSGSEVQGPACRFPFDTPEYLWSLFQGVWLAPCAAHAIWVKLWHWTVWLLTVLATKYMINNFKWLY